MDHSSQHLTEHHLPAADEEELLGQFRAYRTSHAQATRDLLVNVHLYLVQAIARRFTGLGESMDDLVQEGAIGLLNAVNLFDPERGVKFSTYASHLITSQIQHYLRDRGRLIRQPAWVQELSTKVMRCSEQLAHEFGRDPSPMEIAAHLNLPESSVENVLAAQELNRVTSLNAPGDNQTDNDSTSNDKESILPALPDLSLPVEDRIVLEEAIDQLKALEQQTIRLYYFGDMNQSEVARKLGISVNYTSYLLRRATGKIRVIFDEQRLRETAAMMDVETPRPSALGEFPIYDAVTKLYSEAYLRARVAEEIARAQRYPANFALMRVVLQGINPTAEEWSPMIALVAHLLKCSVRVVDLVAHRGDGSFYLLLPHTGREARVLSERIVEKFRQLEEAPASVSLSVGFVVFPLDGVNEVLLFDRVEQARLLASHPAS